METHLIVLFFIIVPFSFVGPLVYFLGIWVAPPLIYFYEGLIIAIKIKLPYDECMEQLSNNCAMKISLMCCIPPIMFLLALSVDSAMNCDIQNNCILYYFGIDKEFKKNASLVIYALFLIINVWFSFKLYIFDQRDPRNAKSKQYLLHQKRITLVNQMETLQLLMKSKQNLKFSKEKIFELSHKSNQNMSLEQILPCLSSTNQSYIQYLPSHLKNISINNCDELKMDELNQVQLTLNELEIYLKNEQHQGHVLLSRSASMQTDQGKQCAICLEEFLETAESSDKRIYTLPCSHSFHSSCILQSFQTINRNCPYCRTSIGQKLSIE